MKNDYRPHILIAVSFLALWLSGCTTRVYGHAYADVPDVYYEEPELVEIGPDIWVVCDHHTAVYYHSGWYWHYESGVWWRSPTWGGSRVRVDVHVVPLAIVHLDHRAHVRFRGHAYANRRRGPAYGSIQHQGSVAWSTYAGAAPGASHQQPRQVAYGSTLPRPQMSPAVHRPSPAVVNRPSPSVHRSSPAVVNRRSPSVVHRPSPSVHRPSPAVEPQRRPAMSPRRPTAPRPAVAPAAPRQQPPARQPRSLGKTRDRDRR